MPTCQKLKNNLNRIWRQDQRFLLKNVQQVRFESKRELQRMASKDRRVTQETFDDIVLENMESFDLTRAEAIVEARAELTAAGVNDFGGIIMDEDVGLRVDRVLKGLREGEWDVVVKECEDGGSAVVEAVGMKGGVEILMEKFGKDDAYREDVLKTVSVVCENCRRNRERVVDLGGVGVLKDIVAMCVVDKERVSVQNVFRACLALVKQLERSKQSFAAGTTLGDVLDMVAKWDGNEKLLQTGCKLLRTLLATDDSTVVATEVFNRARVLAGVGGGSAGGLIPLEDGKDSVISILWKVLGNHDNSEVLNVENLESDTVVVCMTLVRSMAVADEICADIVGAGLLLVAQWLLDRRRSDIAVVAVVSGLLRNVSARDECKDEVNDVLPTLEKVLELHGENKVLAEHFCAIVSSVCLRRPDLARTLMENGILKRVVKLMRTHHDERNVQITACLALRNAVARDEEICRYVRETTEAEKWLRAARIRYTRECRDAAYAALRDLNVLEDSEISEVESAAPNPTVKIHSVVITRS